MHTIVLSDLHLSEEAPVDAKRPMWMAYKQRVHFVDDDFAALLTYFDAEVDGPIELILNGDIFDFDTVLQVPDDPERRVNWLAHQRGLSSEEWMSNFKMQCILADHPKWFDALASFLSQGHRVVFTLGNHDVELFWPSVQAQVRDALRCEDGEQLRFCQFFYLSKKDTYISHGHHFDPNCSLKDPVYPLIDIHGRPRVRIPFGDLANRYMLNGMGYFNPNATSNYIMSGRQYLRFFFRYLLRAQPLLLLTWFWGALVTLVVSMRDHLRPALRDPLHMEEDVAKIANSANATPAMVRSLSALCAPPSVTHPLQIIRELWLDRAFLFLALVFAAWQVVLHVHLALPIHPMWGLLALAIFVPPYLVYAAGVKSTVFAKPLLTERRAALIAQITGAKNVIFGHTHKPKSAQVGPVHLTNGGFWSPAFSEPECENRMGTQTFVWIRPNGGRTREPVLYEWAPGSRAPCRYVTEQSRRSDASELGFRSPSQFPPGMHSAE